jgi:cell surface protein SprA
LEKISKKFLKTLLLVSLIAIGWLSNASVNFYDLKIYPDTPPDTGVQLKYPFKDVPEHYDSSYQNNALYMQDPSNIKTEVEYDPETDQYIIKKKVGDLDYRSPHYMSYDEYNKYDVDKSLREYWKQKIGSGDNTNTGGLFPNLPFINETLDRIFGNNTIDIRPQGSAEIIFALNTKNQKNPAIDVKHQKQTNFELQTKIQMNVVAKIGDRIEFTTSYNTEASFDFENKMKLQFEGKDDDIIKKIEAGDVNFPLSSTLINGSQGLFGFKTQLQFGKTTITSVFSQQRSEASTIQVSGGAQTSQFQVKADDYEENKHFFISQYFRDRYNRSLSNLPVIRSGVNITKIEVWVTNIGPATQENRNIVAFMDLGERDPYNSRLLNTDPDSMPQNTTNSLYKIADTAAVRNIYTASNYLTTLGLNFTQGEDFEKIENAKKLSPSEYTFNSRLGFISLNSTLNADQVLAVSYQYKIAGDTSTYQVGEFSNEGVPAPQALIVKLIKSTATNTKIPLWDLMMKNVYSIGGYQINSQDFRLNVLFTNNELGVPVGYISEGAIDGKPLIQALNLDNLNTQLDRYSDGVFDFIDGAATNGGTIQASNGRVYFPVLEPFGSDLRRSITGGDPNLNSIADKYVYDSLYTMTKTGARQYPEKNKFIIEGRYKSAAGSEISLNAMNVPQGSVKVTAGGILLTENVDYTVDYTLGRVKIINEGVLNSGTPITINLESNSFFNIQSKTFMGTHIDYKFNRDLAVGGTILHLSEQPLTQKINFGDEPISNTVWGLNATYQTEIPLLTRVLDKLPFYSTKAPSKIILNGEIAHLIPGHSKTIGKQGTSYIDDFEGSKSTIDLKNLGQWFLASIPQGQTLLFPEGAPGMGIKSGYNRAKISWYRIDDLFYGNDPKLNPDHIRTNPSSISNFFEHQFFEKDIFPNKELPNGNPGLLYTINLAYYPSERGPYNFDVNDTSGISAGLNTDGTLKNPESRWGGIMRKMETTDLEATNVEYIEFWMMDPFVGNPEHSGGTFFINLGDISEDILRDGRKSYENGLPTSSEVKDVDTTDWGRVPTIQALTSFFDNNANSREYQDIGLDGLNDADESDFFETHRMDSANTSFKYLSRLGALLQPEALQKFQNDPSGDNFHYFLGADYDGEKRSVTERYKDYNGIDGNSPANSIEASTMLPNMEDINNDNTLNESERYFQYQIDLKPGSLRVGSNFITDSYTSTVEFRNKTKGTVTWYQFKVPIYSPSKVVGNISDFKSIRFIRMYMKGFKEPVICRFATLELVRSEWRKFNGDLTAQGIYIPNDSCITDFEISTVSIEENGRRTPINYVLPPGIDRVINPTSSQLQQLNEQSLVLKVTDLTDGDSKAIYKTTDFDFRRYKKIKMFVHAEAMNNEADLSSGDLRVFVRLGTDFKDNYYEYEVPLTKTDWNTTDPYLIWPEENNFEIDLSKLTDAKIKRNLAMRSPGSTVTPATDYTIDDGNNKITIKGMPNISNVKVIMIGVRNPKSDGKCKTGEIWVNELRLTDFDEKGGWAATVNSNITLADLGNLMMAGTYSSAGFGSIDQTMGERKKDNTLSYDVATNLELGKFFPEKAGLRIPMHYDKSEMVNNPEYSPLNPDILFKDELNSYEDNNQRDSIKKISQDYVSRRSINFMNMKKDRVGNTKKPHIYDVENLDFTYAYTEVYSRNVDIEYNILKTYKGAVGYNFSMNPKNVAPFSKNSFLGKSKAFGLIRDANFYYFPKLLSFRTDLDRGYNENLLRNKSIGIIKIDPYCVKTFTWNRQYDLRYDLTKAINFTYTANANARIDELPGIVDKKNSDYEAQKREILDNIKSFGRITNYNQTVSGTWNVPINKLPMMDFVTATAGYTGEYHWTASPLSAIELGNTIENSRSKQLNGNLNFITLYNKSKFLKDINTPKPNKKTSKMPDLNVSGDLPVSNNTPKDSTKKDEGPGVMGLVVRHTLRFLMGARTANFTYSEGEGMLLPGFKPSPVVLGQDWDLMAPGTNFIFGGQRDIRDKAAYEHWLSTDSLLNNAFAKKNTYDFAARLILEPIQDFRIELNANRNYTKIHSEYFRADSILRAIDPMSIQPQETGTLSMSYITWKSSWKNGDDVFNEFYTNRIIVAKRLWTDNPYRVDSTVLDTITRTGEYFPAGYGPTSQDVVIASFIAAYTGDDPSKISSNPFIKMPKPNWSVTYNGLSRSQFVKQFFKKVTLRHTYRSSYNIAYTNNIRYKERGGYPSEFNTNGNYIPQKDITNIAFVEQYSPLIGLDLTFNNNIDTRGEYKKSRNISLSLTNLQVTEVISNEFVIHVGYLIKDVQININTSGKSKPLKSDLKLNSDFSIRNNKSILRRPGDPPQASTGQKIYSFMISGDYMISQKFTIRLFYDRIFSDPYTSNQFRNTNSNAGISLKFLLTP